MPLAEFIFSDESVFFQIIEEFNCVS